MEFIKNGAELIQKMIDNAVSDGSNTCTVTGNYEIEQTILLPSDFVLYLDNCHLRMKDNTFCNMFNNVHCRTPEGRTIDGTDRNITIIGRGRAILDGGEYNGLCERNSQKDGRPHISVNNVILFSNVDGFRIEHIHVRNQRWWALNFIHCRNGYLGYIDFLADYTTIDENGVRHEGLGMRHYDGSTATYEQVYVKNADGIDLRTGCHDIIIENITGFTEDDTIALTGLYGYSEKTFDVEGLDDDIYNVSIRNIQSSAYCAIVRLLNQGGVKLYNILIDGVFDTSKGSKYMERGGSGVRVGDVHMYGSRHATADETFNITVKNVYSRAGAALRLAGAMSNCVFENIRTFDDAPIVIDNNASVDIRPFLK